MRYYILITIMLFTACKKQETEHPKVVELQSFNTIVGTWQTGLIDGEWGESRITTIYGADGSFEGLIDFTNSDELPFNGSYTIKGDVLKRTVEGDIQEITYRIEGDTMYQKVGSEDYVFKKQVAEQD